MGHQMVRSLPRRFGVAGLTLAGLACAPDQRQSLDVLVVDSSGIRIVENRVGETDIPVFGELGAIEVEVGVREGDPQYALTQVLAVRATSSGGLLVAESRSRELRYFDRSGTHLRTVGGQGEGPGEFSSMSTFSGMAADTVWIWDSRNQRITCFAPDGALLDASVIPPHTTYDRLSRLYRLSDESWVGVSPWRNRNRDRPQSLPLKIMRDSLVLTLLQPEGEEADTIAVIPGFESIRRVDLRGTTIAEMNFRRPFGRATYLAPGAQGIVVGGNDQFEIRRFSPDGVLQLVSRTPGLDLPISAEEVQEAKESQLAGASDNPEFRETVEASFSEFPLPDVRPAFSEIRIGNAGEVWLAEYEMDAASVSSWIVLDSDGTLLGRVHVPSGFRIHEIGEDYVLGVWYDEFEVPYLRRYSFIRTD